MNQDLLRKLNFLSQKFLESEGYKYEEMKPPNFIEYIWFKVGVWVTFLERLFFFLPERIKQMVIKIYRGATKTV